MIGRSSQLILTLLTTTVVVLVAALPAFSANPKTRLISQSSSGATGDSDSLTPSISGDGRLVAFASDATTLVNHDTNGQTDVFVRDVKSGKTKRVSVKSNGSQATGGASFSPAISTSGRYVVFSSQATNLAGGNFGVYRHDLKTGKTKTLVTGGDPRDPTTSASGRYVAWDNNDGQIYLFDRNSGKTKLVSKNNQGAIDDDVGSDPSISDDGRYLVWVSDSDNLTPQSAGDHDEIYLRDLKTKTTRMVSKSAGAEGDGDSIWVSISGNGKRVAYATKSSNLVTKNLMGHQAVLVFNRLSGNTTLASVSPAGLPANNGSANFSSPTMSDDGRFVAFASRASDLVTNDLSGHQDVFVRNLKAKKTKRVNVGPSGAEANDYSNYSAISADGRFVAFQSQATNLAGGGAFRDIFRSGPLR